MIRASADPSRERTIDAEEVAATSSPRPPPESESDRTGDREDSGSALTSGDAAEAIERATASVGLSEKDETR